MPQTGISISGGSSKGAFAVGVLQQLRRNWRITFDMVSGTSTGALVAPFVVTGEYGRVEELYSTLSTRDFLVQQSPGDIVRSGYVFNTEGLAYIIEDVYTQVMFDALVASGKQMFITAVQMQSGRVTHFYTGPDAVGSPDQDVVRIENRQHLLDAILASTMQPVIMRPVTISGMQYVDGGVRETAPIKVLIDNGVEDLISVVLTAENEGGDADQFDDLVSTLSRTIGLFTQEVVLNDIRIAETYNDVVRHLTRLRARLETAFPDRLSTIADVFDDASSPFADVRVINLKVVRPAKKLLEDSLRFSQDDMRRMIRAGENRVEELFGNRNSPGPFGTDVDDDLVT